MSNIIEKSTCITTPEKPINKIIRIKESNPEPIANSVFILGNASNKKAIETKLNTMNIHTILNINLRNWLLENVNESSLVRIAVI